MKTLLKIIFNLVTFCLLWWSQSTIIIGVLIGSGVLDLTERIGSLPGLIGIITIFTSYRILKIIHQTEFYIKTFKILKNLEK